jgi:hypothetical protein
MSRLIESKKESQESTVNPPVQNDILIFINGIGAQSDEQVLVVFKENVLVNHRPRQRRITEVLEKFGYLVRSGENIGETPFRSLLVTKPGLKVSVLAILEILQQPVHKVEFEIAEPVRHRIEILAQAAL